MEAKVVAGATIEAESHLTSGRASSKGALAGSRILNTLISVFVVLGNCLSWSLSSSDAKKHKEQCLVKWAEKSKGSCWGSDNPHRYAIATVKILRESCRAVDGSSSAPKVVRIKVCRSLQMFLSSWALQGCPKHHYKSQLANQRAALNHRCSWFGE